MYNFKTDTWSLDVYKELITKCEGAPDIAEVRVCFLSGKEEMYDEIKAYLKNEVIKFKENWLDHIALQCQELHKKASYVLDYKVLENETPLS